MYNGKEDGELNGSWVSAGLLRIVGKIVVLDPFTYLQNVSKDYLK